LTCYRLCFPHHISAWNKQTWGEECHVYASTTTFVFVRSNRFFTLALLIPRVGRTATQPHIPPAPSTSETKAIQYYEPAGDAYLDFPDGKGRRHLTLRGEQWTYRTTFGKGEEVQRKSILNWLTAQAGSGVLAAAPEEVVGRIQPDVNERLTYHFRISRDTTIAQVYRERVLSVDYPLLIALEPKEQRRVSFWVDHDGRHYQSLVVEFEQKDVVLDGTARSSFNDYERSVHHKHTCRIEHGSRQVVFDLPQNAGTYEWIVYSQARYFPWNP